MSGAPDAHGGGDDHHAALSSGGEGFGTKGPAQALAGFAAATCVTTVGGAICTVLGAFLGGR